MRTAFAAGATAATTVIIAAAAARARITRARAARAAADATAAITAACARLRTAVCCAALLAILPAHAEVAPADFLPPAPDGKAWTLVWHDEFEGDALDETKWNRLGDWKRRDGHWIREDAYLSGKGTLVLRTRKDGDRYTCGAVNTRGKFERAFGYFVARCKAPREPGHWPAFWMMSAGVSKVGDDGRDGTEIDIMEMPWRDGKVTFNLHWDGYGKEHKSAGTNTVIAGLMEGFHDYGLLWTPEEYVFYVDGREVWRTRAGGVCQVPSFLKLTEEIGTWAGSIADAKLPDTFEVEYVRVYEWTPERP